MLSRYKILERIGTGGFGVVYRAEDRTLKRQVAVKFLSVESFEKDHTWARFQREARLAASLNHPNICTVYEVGEVASDEEFVFDDDHEIGPGTPFIVMEFVEGQSLDQILKNGGSMPVPRILDIAVQVAESLVEAHANSIVHRDLKPKNVMVTSEQRVKILDFGMAKPLRPADDDDALMKTTEEASIELTREGMVLGTIAYMSPEQACGKPVDSRSDVFSFGVMLYEMAAGKKPFEGDSLTSTMAKILETEPSSLADSRSDLPLELARIIHRCLRKDRESRYNDTRDLAVTLKDLLHETSSGAVRKMDPAAAVSDQAPAASARSKSRRAAIWAAAGAAAILAGLALAFVIPKLIRPARDFVPPSFRQVTFSGSASYPTLAPDGQSLAFVTDRPGGGYRVVIQDLARGQQLPIFDAAWIRSLRWSPSGAELLISGSSMDDVIQTYLVSRLGGATRPMRYLPFVAWSPDSSRFAGTTLSAKQIWFTEVSTGATTAIELSGAFAFIYEIAWSPIGEVLAFRTSDDADRQSIWTTTTDGAEQQIVVDDADALYSPRFSPGGDAIYYLAGNEQVRELRKIEIDARTGARVGGPVVLVSGLQAGNQMTFSLDGKRLYYAREVSHANLWLVERQSDGGAATSSQLTRGTFRHGAPRFSPDGNRLALTRASSSNPNLFVMTFEERQPEQLTFMTAQIWQPVWSPDGDEIAFGLTTGDETQIWKVGARGGSPQPFENSSLSRDIAWAPGSKIIYQRPGNSAFHFLDPNSGDESGFMDDSSGGSAADPLQFFSWMASPEYSPDGKRVAISCNCPGGEGLWVMSLDGSSEALIYDDNAALPVGWSADGAWVYAMNPDSRDLVRIPSNGGSPETLVEIPFERVGDIDITPDGKRLVCEVPVSQADIWLIENFDPELSR